MFRVCKQITKKICKRLPRIAPGNFWFTFNFALNGELQATRLLSCQSRILLQKKFTELEDSRLISTHRKNFKTWISFEIRSVFLKKSKICHFFRFKRQQGRQSKYNKKIKRPFFLKRWKVSIKKFAIKTELQLSPITLSKYNDSKQANRGLGSSTTRAAFKAI